MVVLQFMEMINFIGLGKEELIRLKFGIPSSIPQNQFDLCAKIYTISYVHRTLKTLGGTVCACACLTPMI